MVSGLGAQMQGMTCNTKSRAMFTIVVSNHHPKTPVFFFFKETLIDVPWVNLFNTLCQLLRLRKSLVCGEQKVGSSCL